MTAFVRRTLVYTVAFAAWATMAHAQKITVTAADPSAGSQGTIALDVHVTGSGFQQGAVAHFYKSKTTDPGGITVRQSTFVSSTELVATVDIATDAALSTFDVVVTQSSRSGKGGDLFQVVQSSGVNASCTLEPLDTSRFTLNAQLNPNASLYGPKFGVSNLLAKATLTNLPGGASTAVLVAAVGTTAVTSRVELFVVDPISGAVIQDQPLCPDCEPQPHRSVLLPPSQDGLAMGTGNAFATGDVNGDGIPDFLYGRYQANGAVLLVSSQDANGRLDWVPLLVPRATGIVSFGAAVAVGDIDGDGRDEFAVSSRASGTGKRIVPAAVYVYRFVASASMVLVDTIAQTSVTPSQSNGFGYSMALADVVGDGRADLAVGVPERLVNGVSQAGGVFVLERVGAEPTGSFTRTARVLVPSIVKSGSQLGFSLAAGNADGSADGRADLVATTLAGGAIGGEVFSSPVADGQVGRLRFAPRPSFSDGWGTNGVSIGDVNGDGLPDMAIGAPSAGQSSCQGNAGMAYLFLATQGANGTVGWTTSTLQAPEFNSTYAAYGYSTAVLGGYPFLLVGEQGRNPNGQSYVYRVIP